MTRFELIKQCESPEDMCVILAVNERSFCPYRYDKNVVQFNPDTMDDECISNLPCGECICNWLKAEEDEHIARAIMREDNENQRD